MTLYIDMGEGITGKQDRPSMIIDGLTRAPQIAKNVDYLSYKNVKYTGC